MMVIDKFEQPGERIWPDKGFLVGRTALVTGGARRLGRHLARALAEQGADLVLHYYQSDFEAKATADELARWGGRVFLVQGDLADPFVAEDLLLRAGDQLGVPVDLLVNNAACFGPGTATGTSADDWREYQSINLRAPFLLAQALANSLSEQQTGDVINLNDFRALRPSSDNFAYTMSKWGLHGLTRNLALALAPRVRVNELAIGAVLPPKVGPEHYRHTTRDEIPVGRFVTPGEVCTSLLYLLANPALTGQTLYLDGGQNLQG